MQSSSNWEEVLNRIQDTLTQLGGKVKEGLVEATLLSLYRVIPQILAQKSVRAAKWAVEQVLLVNPNLPPQQIKALVLSDPRWILLGLEYHSGEWSTEEVIQQLASGNYQGLFTILGWFLTTVDPSFLKDINSPADMDVLIDEALYNMKPTPEKPKLEEIYQFMKMKTPITYSRFLEILMGILKGKTMAMSIKGR